MKFIKNLLLTIFLISLLGCVYYLNVKLSTEPQIEEPVVLVKPIPKPKIDLIEVKAKIISADSKIPLSTARKYAKWIQEASMKYKVDPVLIMAIISAESNFNHKAVSPTGPIGLLQIAHYWHREKSSKEALYDPRTNIMVGTRIMKEYYTKGRDDFSMLLRYNASEHKESYARNVLRKKQYYKTRINKALKK